MHEQGPRDLGRYVLYDPIASGGMATVHFGRMHGAVGFSRLVAIKRLHPNFVGDPGFVAMFLDEARLAARLDHPNVVKTLDVVADDKEVFLVMEHILGESLEAVMPRDAARPVPPPIASAILCGLLEGLHGAHEARGDDGAPLAIVHRDVSPHNVLLGVDGVPRVFDFGIAKATINTQETREGVIKGKVTYMAPEQVWGHADRRADLYAAGVILWELLAGRRRHAGERNDTLFLKLAKNALDPLGPLAPLGNVPPALDAVVGRATASQVEDRFPDARSMAVAIEAAIPPAPAREVAAWLREVAGEKIDRRSAVMRRIEVEVQKARESSPTLSEVAEGSATLTRAGGLASSLGPAELEGEPPPGAAARVRWGLPLALGALVVVLAVVGIRIAGGSAVRPEPAAPPAAAAPSPPPVETPAASTPAPPPVPVTASASASAAPKEPSPPVTAPKEPARPVFVPPPPRPARAPEPPVTAAAPSAPPSSAHRGGCETPFVIGPDGIRQVKPECL